MKKTYLNPMAELDVFQNSDVLNASGLDQSDGVDINVGGSLLPEVLSAGGNAL